MGKSTEAKDGTGMSWLIDHASTLAIGAAIGIVIYHFGISYIISWVKSKVS